MANSKRSSIARQIQRFKKSLFQLPDLPFTELLSKNVITKIIEQAASGRDQVFSPLVTLKAFMLQVLSGDGSCKQAVARVLSERLEQGLEANSVNTGPYCKARQRLGLESLTEAVQASGKALEEGQSAQWKWKGHEVLLADGTTVLMPDTQENQSEFPQQTNQKPGLGFPIARLVGLISLGVGSVTDYRLGPYQGKGSGETSLFSELMPSLQAGNLLLADRYYCTYAIIAQLQQQGVHVVFKNHANRKPDFRRGKKLGSKDHLIEWYKPKRGPVWMSPQDYAALPEVIQVRELAVGGIVYVTTLIEEKNYPRKEIASFYKERWKVELDLRSIKTDMGMERLRCKTPQMVKKEVAVYFLAYNLIRANMAQAAHLHNKIPRQLSFKATVQLITTACAQLIGLSAKAFSQAAYAIFKAIASTPIGRQKRKPQPRAIKRRPKAYPLLTEPRQAACQRLESQTVNP